jgi:hypothetical protein
MKTNIFKISHFYFSVYGAFLIIEPRLALFCHFFRKVSLDKYVLSLSLKFREK